jgi:hypothetical protein
MDGCRRNQDGIRKHGDQPGKVYVRYDHLFVALMKVYNFCKLHDYTIHMPRIGCGLGGGNWDEVEKVIGLCLDEYYVRTYVYDPFEIPEKEQVVKMKVEETDVGW